MYLLRVFDLAQFKLSPDILNRLNPAYYRKPKVDPAHYVDPDPRVQAENSRLLAKYVFPRQYGLSNVFEIPGRSKKAAASIPDFSDRDDEIKV